MKSRFGAPTSTPHSTADAGEQQAAPVTDLRGAQELAAARTQFEKARLALDMGKPRLAVTLLESCLAIEADHPEYLGLWGYSQTLIGGNLKAALDACERALAARSYDATLHTQMGCVLQASGRREEARQFFENALQKDPQQRLAKTQLQSLEQQSVGSSLKAFLRRFRR